MAGGRGSRPDGRSTLALPLGVSAAVHLLAAVGLLVAGRGETAPPMPPMYRVDLVAAPPGPRAIGVVNPPPAPATEPPATVPPRAERPAPPTPSTAKSVPVRTPPKAATPVTNPTPARPSAPAPAAGGGPVGGRGSDVANVRTEGIEFPHPGYLNNIVRQIALRFRPDNPNAPLSADVFFLLHRDGTISDFRFIKRSGVYAFDLEAQGAVEAAASASSFGPLPAAFPDDVLPVIFSFDPRLIR